MKILNLVISDGQWSGWQAWSDCSVPCGQGVKTRTRTCNNPLPLNGGKNCVGSVNEVVLCDEGECSVRDGKWGLWSSWSLCSSTCSKGFRKRVRKCNNPTPINGKDCEGNNEIVEVCKDRECGEAVNGNWGLWSVWSSCDKTCGPGVKAKRRSCDNPPPQWGGKECEGDGMLIKTCQEMTCEIVKTCEEFEPWGDCNSECGMGIQSRKRSCLLKDKTSKSANSSSSIKRQFLNYEHKFCSNRNCPGKQVSVFFLNSLSN